MGGAMKQFVFFDLPDDLKRLLEGAIRWKRWRGWWISKLFGRCLRRCWGIRTGRRAVSPIAVVIWQIG